VKRVLIITYYWPPAGGIGVLRCLKIAKHLRQYGWEPIIYTAENPHYPTIDYSNDKDIPQGITVLRGRIWEPYHIYKFLTGKPKDANVNNVFYVRDEPPGLMHRFSVWMRSNFFIPDARAAWIKPSLHFLRKYLQDNPVDAIFSDGPPHSNTRIATLLKKETGIPWLADFQDPWTQVDYYQLLRLTPWGDRRHRRMEQEAFYNADRITIVSPTWKKYLERIGARHVSVIPWGYDPDDYQNLPLPERGKFILTHTGILGYDRNMPGLWHALSDLCAENHEFRNYLEIRLVGQVDTGVLESLHAAGLGAQVVMPGNLSRQEALQASAQSGILLLPLNQQANAMGRIPGKLFEYLALRRPVLCIGPPEADASRIIIETRAGCTFEPDDKAGIKDTISEWFAQFKSGKLFDALTTSIEPYSNVQLSGQFARLLDEIS